jgi:hypothetical protein
LVLAELVAQQALILLSDQLLLLVGELELDLRAEEVKMVVLEGELII